MLEKVFNLNKINLENNSQMSLNAVFDIAIHLEKFRNIDLFKQGIYFIKFKLF